MAKWSEYIETDTTYDRETDETVDLVQRHKVSKWREISRTRGRGVLVHHEGDVLAYTGSGDIRPRVKLECPDCSGFYMVGEQDRDCFLVHFGGFLDAHRLMRRRDGA